MLFNEILDGIETILKADANTKNIIKEYRQYKYEQGMRATPFCISGIPVEAAPETSDVDGGVQIWDGDVTILLLGQAYDVPSRQALMRTTLDKLQSDAFKALNADKTLSGSVIESRLDKVRSVRIDEYFGFMIKISILKKE